MKTIYKFKIQIPVYVIMYVEYNNREGLTDEDIYQCDKYLKQFDDMAKELNAQLILAQDDNEPYFTWHPPFGLACDVQDYTILIGK